MVFSNSNIYAKEWLDIIFANRNKEYGAYELRQLAPKATNIALGIVVFIVLAICAVGYASQGHKNSIIPEANVALVELMDEEVLEVEKVIEEPKQSSEAPQQVAQDVPAMDVVKFTEINATDRSKVDEDVVTNDALLDKKTLPGNITMKGMDGGSLVPKGTFGKSKRDGGERGVARGSLTGDPNAEQSPLETVEIMPEPIGGMKEFVKWVAENYDFPSSAVENGAKGVIRVKFVVEKDGRLSSFEVIDDMGYGTGTAAVSLLKRAKKWNAGIQNGVPVRVSFNLPIRLQVNQQ